MKKKEEEAIAFLKDVNESIKKAEPFQLEYKEGWYKKILIILAEKDFNNFDIIFNLIEKIKELEKGNRSLMESRKKWKNRYYKEKAKNKEKKAISQAIIRDTFIDRYISKDKIKELKEKVEKEMINNPYDFSYMINELLEENNNE